MFFAHNTSPQDLYALQCFKMCLAGAHAKLTADSMRLGLDPNQ